MRRTGRVWCWTALSVGAMALTALAADSRTTRDSKGSPVAFHQASDSPVSGFQRVEVAGSTVYVSPRPIWSGGDVVSAQTREGRTGTALDLTLSADAARQVDALSADRVAIYVDGKISSVGTLTTDGGRITIDGLTSPSTERVVKLLNGIRPAPAPSPITASIRMVPVGMEDGAYVFDVFVTGATNLRTYQVGVEVHGGSAGALAIENVRLDMDRADYVFHDMEVIAAPDEAGGRVMGVLQDGGVTPSEPAYLGTYVLRPTPDAAGTFTVAMETQAKTLLADPDSARIEFVAGPDIDVTIGSAPVVRDQR